MALLVLAGLVAVFQVNTSSWAPAPEASPGDSWYAFTSPDGSWSAQFPGESPAAQTRSVNAGLTDLSMTMYISSDGFAAYEASEVDGPASLFEGQSEQSILDEFAPSFEATLGATIGGKPVGTRTLTVQGHQAREAEFRSSQLDAIVRYWVAGQRIYMLMAAAPPDGAMYPEHFFDAFQMH